MDCLEAQRILSEAFDGEPVDAEVLRRAETHCASCAECAGFRDAMRRVAAAEHADGAPEAVVSATLERVDRERAADRAQQTAPEGHGEPDGIAGGREDEATPTPFPRQDRVPRLAVIVTAAASILVIGVLSFAAIRAGGDGGFVGTSADLETSSEAADPIEDEAYLLDEDTDRSRHPTNDDIGSATDGGALAGETAPAGEPRFASYEGLVYRPVTGTLAEDASVTTETVLTLDLGKDGTRELSILRSGADRLYAVTDEREDVYLLQPVTRTYEGDSYQLTTGDPIRAFGEWPTLPDGLVPPADPSGTPTFEEHGADGAGVTVFVRVGFSPVDGVAIAPSPPAGDPAAGSPVWTFWEPVD